MTLCVSSMSDEAQYQAGLLLFNLTCVTTPEALQHHVRLLASRVKNLEIQLDTLKAKYEKHFHNYYPCDQTEATSTPHTYLHSSKLVHLIHMQLHMN